MTPLLRGRRRLSPLTFSPTEYMAADCSAAFLYAATFTRLHFTQAIRSFFLRGRWKLPPSIFALARSEMPHHFETNSIP